MRYIHGTKENPPFTYENHSKREVHAIVGATRELR